MKAAILARGGSIWRTWGAADRSQYAFRIAVNCAINEFQAEYLVACDPSTWLFVTGKPLIAGYFRGDLAQKGEVTPPYLLQFRNCGYKINDIAGKSPYDFSFSIESAIQVAVEKGAKQIDLYGTLNYSIDADGNVNWRPDDTDIHSPGRGLSTNRDRWVDEAQRMYRIINHYAQQGVTIGAVR